MSYIPLTPSDSDGTQTQYYPAETTFDALSNARRRATLAVLTARDACSIETLATHVTAREQAVDVEDVSEDQRHTVETTLFHCHLPKLEEFGLVESTDDQITLTDDAPDVEAMGLLDVPEEADDLFDALASDQRRAMLAVLAAAGELTVDDLAATVTDDDVAGPDAEFPAADSSRMEILLHHRHLPKLDAVGLVDYDHDSGVVEFDGHPLLRDVWVDPDAVPHSKPGPMPSLH